MSKYNRPTKEYSAIIRRFSVLNTALISLIILVTVCAIIVSAIARNTLRNFELVGESNSIELPTPSKNNGTVTQMLQLAYIYGEAGLHGMKDKLIGEIFSLGNGRTEVLSYFEELLSSSDSDSSSASKFVVLADIVSDHITTEEIMSDIMLRHFDQKYTNRFYYVYKMLLPTVGRAVIDVFLEKAEKTDLYHAYLIHSAIDDAESRAWCDAHDIVNMEIVSSSDGETVYHIKHYYDKNGLLTDVSEERDDDVIYTLFEYNEFGKLDSEMIHYTNNYSSDSYLKSKVNYFYDKNGNLTKKQIEDYGSNERLLSTKVISYGTDGRIESETVTQNGASATTIYLYVFDDEGRLAEEAHFLEGDLIYQLGYSYNNPELPDKPSEVQNYINGVLYQYVYNKSGKIEILREWISGQVDKETEYVYDVLGNLRSVTEWSRQTILSETVYSYECRKSSDKEEQK